MSAKLIKQLREQRMQWLELEPGKRVRIIRPTEVETVRHLLKDRVISIDVDEVKRFVVDWDGFTEATLLGAAVGSADPVAFSSELWEEVASDRAQWVRQIVSALLDMVLTHSQAAQEEEKN